MEIRDSLGTWDRHTGTVTHSARQCAVTGALGMPRARLQGLWLLVPDSSMNVLCDLGQGGAPIWNSLALFTNEGIGLESSQQASSSNMHHLLGTL